MTHALYAGSFDPPTFGHLWIIDRAAELFGRVTVGVAENPDKRCAFSLHDRVAMLMGATAWRNVTIAALPRELVAEYAGKIRATHLVRGVRSQADFAYELGMRHVNGDFNSLVTTVFLTPPRDLCEVSSSLVKGLVGFERWEDVVSKYVPSFVVEKLRSLK